MSYHCKLVPGQVDVVVGGTLACRDQVMEAGSPCRSMRQSMSGGIPNLLAMASNLIATKMSFILKLKGHSTSRKTFQTFDMTRLEHLGPSNWIEQSEASQILLSIIRIPSYVNLQVLLEKVDKCSKPNGTI